MLLKKEKRLNLLLFNWPNAKNGPRRAAPGLRPDSQRAGHQAGPSLSPAWASFGLGRRGALTAVGSDPTAVRLFRGIKTPGDAVRHQTLGHSPPLSLLVSGGNHGVEATARRSGRDGAGAACSPARALAIG